MPRIAALLLAALILIVSGQVAGAQIRFADMVRAIRLGGTERMMVFALSDPGLPPDAWVARERLLQGLGVRAPAGAITRRNLSYAPILTWDSNINGGYGNSEFTFAGLPFAIGKQYRAVSGLLIGGSVVGSLRMGLGGRTGLALSAHANAAWSPEHDMWKLSAGASACANRMISHATWGHGCLDASWRRIELGESDRYGARVGLSHAFFSGIGIHELAAELQHNRHDGSNGYDQRLAGLSLTSALSGGYALVVGAQVGEEVGQVDAMRERIWIGMGFELSGRPAWITLGAQRNRGGAFLSEALEKRVWSVGLSYRASDDFGLSVHGSRTDSNVSFYDDGQIGLSLDWRFRTR